MRAADLSQDDDRNTSPKLPNSPEMTTIKDSELREAIIRIVLKWIANDIPEETTELHRITHHEWQSLYDKLEALFNHQRQLLLGQIAEGMPKKWILQQEDWNLYDTQYQEHDKAIDQVIALLRELGLK